jgi:N-acyl-D-amino-acid deacylase
LTRAFDVLRAVTVVVALGTSGLVSAQAASFVVTRAQVADGSGGALRTANVRIVDGRITDIGGFRPRSGETVVDGSGRVLAPGFIDIHNHSTRGVEREPGAASQVSQGITTIVVGQDGSSPLPIGDYLAGLRAKPPALNVATCVGHATVRSKAMGEDYKRASTAAEIAAMEALVDQAFKDGALCLSSGLEYEIGSYSTTDELVYLAKIAAKHGGFYISHTRDEADRSFESMREVIEIGRRAKLPVQNTHWKLGTVGVWGKAKEAVAIYDAARKEGVDVTADVYPWEAWSSTIFVLVPDRKYENPTSIARGFADVGGAQNVLITSYEKDRSYEFKTMAEIAKSRRITDVELFLEITKHGGASVVGKSMMEEDIRALFTWPWTMVSSDGGIEYRHPRGAGTFPRVLGRYVRERRWLKLEEAIRKMTSLPAWRLGLRDRGAIKPGYVADLVLFNPATVIDNATFLEPFRLSTGIERVWVRGTPVWSHGKTTGERPGRTLTRER